jgi:alpha-2-macroglobulin
MLAFVRAAFAAVLIAGACAAAVSTSQAQKAYQRDDLADAAIKLEGELRREAGAVGKPLATLRREADLLLDKRDFRAALPVLAQIIAVEPALSRNWLRLSRTVLQLNTGDSRERAALLERAATAAYIAYQRAAHAGEENESLVLLSRTFADRRLWRPALDTLRLALDLREAADDRARYEQMRGDHGFRLLDYTVDSDAASPRACFQFSEELPAKRTDFSPFVAVGGIDKPAITVEEKQLCVEGLRHGDRYAVTLRAGLPSSVREALIRSADFNIYVRDRKPFVRFTGRAYVLPKTGQRGIPVVSVNTRKLKIRILRVGDRNLLGTVLGSDFQRNMERYELNRLAERNGVEVWKGELAVESVLNADVVTAFPIDQAVGDTRPGVYLMSAMPDGPDDSDSYDAVATQWFIVSDLGLSSFSGGDGVHVSVQSLATARPKAGIEVRLIARSNEVLAARTSDAEGAVRFEPGLARGEGGLAPAMIVAADPAGDYAFLSLRGPAFDLSDRGVAGRTAPAGLDGFVYTERGVYRSGETVHITALLRDARGVAATGIPLTLVVERPDGVEYRRTLVPDQGLGGRALSLPIVGAAPTGRYRVKALVDPKGQPVDQTTFLVEDYVPDRMEFDLAASAGTISRDEPTELTVNGRYLYGAPASALTLEGEVVIRPGKERPGFAGYQFGMADEEATPERQPLENLPDTDAEGKARFKLALAKLPATSRPLQAEVTVRMAEPGGRAVERKLALPVTPAAPMIGVKPLFSGRALGEGETATFDVTLVSTDGKMLARRGLRYELVKVEQRYTWYRRDNRWEYEPVKSTRRVADGTVDVAADRPGRIAAPVAWGRYRLEVTSGDASGPVTSVAFDAGFYAEASADTPDVLEIALDKPEYRAGETMTVAVTARTAGRVTLSVVGDRLISTTTAEVQPGQVKLPLTVGQDWGTGAYVVATLRRPLDAEARRMPGRAIGVQWFAVDRKARTLALDMPLPALVRPNSPLRVPFRVGGLAPGEEARIVVAAVDVGILNLTSYKPPAPDEHYFGQRRLSVEVRDLYGQLIDGMAGTRGAIRTGGDGDGAMSGAPPTQPPLALYSGLVTVAPDGSAEVSFDIPAFAGSVRVMAIAWSKDKVGRASGDVTVRDPVVATTTLPRFLLTGDSGTLRLDLDNVEGAAGDYRLAVTTDGPFTLGDGASQTLRLAARQRSGLSLPITATGVGVGQVAVRIAGPDNFTLERSYTLVAKPSTQVLTRRTVNPLAKGESLTLSRDLFADLVGGTGSVALSVGPSTALDVAALLQALDRYPFGCSEQIASRAMPLLYVNELASERQLALDIGAGERVRDAIERLLARQGSNGSFGLWGTGGNDPWLDAYVTDFLTRAREKSFVIPDIAFKLALDRLRNFVGTAPEPDKDGGRELAYALYVLARNGVAPIGDLRYLADTKLAALATPIAKAQIAAALALLGDRARAERVYAAALAAIAPQPRLDYGRSDYGSALRDSAALVTLAAEAGGSPPLIREAVQRVEAARGLTPYTSTQEQAWMVLAARALGRETRGTVEVDGEARTGSYYRRVRAEALGAPLKLTNTGDLPLQAVVSVSGAPVTPEPAADRGFKIERLYYTLAGEPADPSTARQNQRFAVVLKITEPKPDFARVIVADYLPAGFEIDNPRLVSSGDTGTLSWIEDALEPVHTEFRDDRFVAAFDRKAGAPSVFTVAYVVRAVSPGRYVLPQAFIEDMYRPDRFGRTATGAIEVQAAR